MVYFELHGICFNGFLLSRGICIHFSNYEWMIIDKVIVFEVIYFLAFSGNENLQYIFLGIVTFLDKHFW